MKYNLAAQLVERVDQRQTKVTTEYDAAGRQRMVRIDGTNTTDGPLLGAKALGYTYSTSDQLLTATTWSSNTDTSDGNRLTKVTRQYDGWGNLTSERQEQWAGQNHYDQTVAYTFSYSPGSNYLRPANVVYPTGSRALTYGYGDAGAGQYTSAYISSQVNRMDRLTFDSTRVTVFDFAANGRTDKRTYWKGTGANDTVATTAYSFDAFGRMTEIDATDTAAGHIIDFRRAYDYNGNPLYTEYAHKTTRSEVYGTQTGGSPEGPADALNRLTRYPRGTLNANKDDVTNVVFEQDWHDTQGVLRLDKLGNWDMVRTDADGSGNFTVETKGHNLANEYTSKNGQTAFAHDDDGNLKDDGTFTFDYDFANHLVKAVKKDGGATIGEYAYDALGRRIKKVVTNTDTWDGTTLLYYDGLQAIEEGTLAGNAAYKATHQRVWGLYLDELLLYDYDADTDGDFDAVDQPNGDARYYALHDFIYSTAALMNFASAVQERYDYEPYGKPTIWNPAYVNVLQPAARRNNVLFTGQRYEPETQLYDYKTRSSHPSIGCFLQRDALGFVDWMSLYCYVTNAPQRHMDPLGMKRKDPKEFAEGFVDAVYALETDTKRGHDINDDGAQDMFGMLRNDKLARGVGEVGVQIMLAPLKALSFGGISVESFLGNIALSQLQTVLTKMSGNKSARETGIASMTDLLKKVGGDAVKAWTPELFKEAAAKLLDRLLDFAESKVVAGLPEYGQLQDLNAGYERFKYKGSLPDHTQPNGGARVGCLFYINQGDQEPMIWDNRGRRVERVPFAWRRGKIA